MSPKPPVLYGVGTFPTLVTPELRPAQDAMPTTVVPALPNVAPPQRLAFHNIYGCSSPLAA